MSECCAIAIKNSKVSFRFCFIASRGSNINAVLTKIPLQDKAGIGDKWQVNGYMKFFNLSILLIFFRIDIFISPRGHIEIRCLKYAGFSGKTQSYGNKNMPIILEL